jgi:signal transduction histidine kinase
VLLGGAASMLLSATGGTTALAATGAVARGTYGTTWLVWWIGDALGVVIFAPLLLTFLSPASDLSPFRLRFREAAALFTGAAVTTVLVFRWDVPLPYLVFPFAIWAAIRFYQQGAAGLTVLVSGIAIVETAAHHGPFSMLSRTTNLVSLQLFNATLAMIALSLAAVTRERISESEKARRLAILDEFKDSLLTAVSHELRTPLTVIIGLSSTLKNHEHDLSPEETQEALERLESNAHRLDTLLMDMLDLDRLNRRVIEPHPRAVEIRECVLRVLDTLEVPNRPVDVSLGHDSASVDPAHLDRIIENLVANAVRHTPPGTPIWIRTERTSEGVVLLVEDAGPGVPDALRTEIFEPFRRGNTNSHLPGTGVGLSLVSRFAGLNGGRAWVEERPGGGSSFRVLLPSGSAAVRHEPDRAR